MFEGILEKFLLKYFGEYLKGIDKSNLSVAVWKGEILVKTVELNPAFIEKLGLPLRLAFGKIDRLMLRVPWNNLSSKPVELEIDSISVILSFESIATWFSEKNYLDFCNALLSQTKDEIQKKLEEEFENQEKKGSFAGKIFDNLCVKIKNIHLRIENSLSTTSKFGFGAILEDFTLQSVDETGKSVFIKRQSMLDNVTKLVRFKNLALYYHPNTTFSQLADLQQSYLFTSYVSDWSATVHPILSLNLDFLFTLTPVDKKALQNSTLEKKNIEPMYKLTSEIAEVSFSLTTEILRDLVCVGEYFSEFSRQKMQ